MSQVLFQRPLSADGLRLVMRREEKSTSSGWFSWGRSTTLKKPQPSSTQPQQPASLRYKASEPILGGASSASPPRVLRSVAKVGAETESLRSSSPPPRSSSDHPRFNYAKSLRLSSDQLKSLNLQDGVNTVQFSVHSSFQGKAVCSAKIFLWNHDTKIVISDVDGTITKSDVLGHVFTMGKSVSMLYSV
jgi:phosphatidate phosphatase LPIN